MPEEAYEFNFVLHDNEGTYENNAGQDFFYPVLEGSTPERWSEILAERVATREAQRAVRGCRLSITTRTRPNMPPSPSVETHACVRTYAHTSHTHTYMQHFFQLPACFMHVVHPPHHV